MPGVIDVLTGVDIEAADGVPNSYFGLARRDQPPLALGKVRYAGDPVALAVADTLPMIVTVDACLKEHPDSTLEEVRDSLAGNRCRCGSYVSILGAVTDLVADDGS